MRWSSKSVLVTGAGGFIASHLTERLVTRGARTRALVRYTSTGSRGWLDHSAIVSDMEIILGDVRDADSVRKCTKGIDTIFHLAALIGIPYSYHAPSSYLCTNAQGSLNIFQAALDEGVGCVVHTSTSEVYGSAQRVPMSEGHPLQGQSPYSASKIAADKMAEAFYCSFGLPVVTVRPFNTYGPRQSARAVIPTIVTQALEGPTVRLGSAKPRRDFTFVEDVVEGFVRAAECPAAVGRVVNLANGSDICIGQLVGRIGSILGRDLHIETEDARIRPELSEVVRLCGDAALARSLLGWEPKVSLDAGLAVTIRWIAENAKRYRVETYAI